MGKHVIVTAETGCKFRFMTEREEYPGIESNGEIAFFDDDGELFTTNEKELIKNRCNLKDG